MRLQRLNRITPTLLLAIALPLLPPSLQLPPAEVRAQTLQDRKVEEFRLYREGVELLERDRYQAALERFAAALAIAKEMNNLQRQARTFDMMGYAYFTMEEYPKALEFYQQAISIYRSLGETDENGELSYNSVYKNDEAALLNQIGSVYSNLGEAERALVFHQKALEIANQKGTLALQKTALNNIGIIYSDLGEYALALESLQEALDLHSQVPTPSGADVHQYNLGLVYFRLGEYNRALTFFENTLKNVRKRKDKAGEIRTLNVIGNVHNRRQDYEAALNFYQQALALAKTLERPSLEGATLNNIGQAYAKISQYDRALSFYQQGLAIYQTTGKRAGEGFILGNIGETYFQLGREQTALDYYQQALAIAQETGNRARAGEMSSKLGSVFQKQNDPNLAIIFFKNSVNIREQIRQNIASLSQDVRQAYTDLIAQDYRTLADLLLQQNRLLEAQRVLDLLKVQELNDYLQNVRGNDQTSRGIANHPIEEKIASDYQNLSERAVAIAQQLSQLRAIEKRSPQQEEELAQLIAAQSELLRQFNAFIDSPEVQENLARLSRTSQRQNLNLEELNALQDNLKNLNQKAALLYPLILKDRLELILVTADSPPLRRTVPVTREQLNKAIVAARSALQNPQSDPKESAKTLYNWLIKPLEIDLKTAQVETIIYAPDGPLRYVSLAAFYDGEQWLVERFRTNIITAASLTDFNTKPQVQPRILAGAFASVSYPVRVGEKEMFFAALPFAGTEVKNLAAAVPETTPLFDRAFSKAETLLKMDDYNIVHLATHGAFISGTPQDSFIVFGDGQIATLNEIKNWSLKNVDLVVLSACQTGLGGRFENGEEILGLGYQFQRAGARAAIASLWAVDDGGTQKLMNEFYRGLQQPGTSKTEALRQAQIAAISGEDRRLRHPFYWAAFILIGNGL